jgi:hypothetical protein
MALIMSAEILLILVLIAAALAGDFLAQPLILGIRIPSVQWIGASLGVAIAILTLGACTGGLFFWVDPEWWIIQAPLIGGIVGAVVEVPLLIYRGRKQLNRGWRTVSGFIWLVFAAIACLVLIVLFRLNYKEVVLPI